ncbi:hypothetical protein AXK56_15850 [Tsukamurella pulmonis]|uniref:Uncharacterized protein n=1 Tax=Tsukamurella pulmonis TaxID=47312 RepID=A0A1H1G5P4_9ACTN|nr:hypothetical protein [Tsukamurella pulmonis]KXO87847.1 hypothetical protein AXK56_15850 [Tsukamurella pulmonis]SDR08582.1 hypothetical protein SAMN04489765_3129 [Tsukamurella pulmonis]SUP17818.1 Uncharacterised protein [Tsukamurella pulmonis]
MNDDGARDNAAQRPRLLTEADVARLRQSFAAIGDDLPPEIVVGAPWPRSRLLDEDLYPRRVDRTPELVESDNRYIAKLLQEIGRQAPEDG